nr:6262_t:CDS:2 [Entrophospora candida]
MSRNSDSQSLYLPNSKSVGRLPGIIWRQKDMQISKHVNPLATSDSSNVHII